MTEHSLQQLDDDAIARFVRDGYLTVQTSLPQSFHSDVRRRAGDILDREGNWGNNILPRLPELQYVFDDPAVDGALSSLLGPGYAMHPHRYCHRNEPGSTAQRLHKDTREFSGDRHLRHQRPRWLVAFYYPQDVTEDMGPTAIVPRSQYYLDQPDANAWPELRLCPSTGTVAIVHFGMWHGATANRSPGPRYMFKFEFGRMDEPSADKQDATVEWPTDGGPVPHAGLWSGVWSWLRGGRHIATSSEAIAHDGLQSGDVRRRRAAADALALEPLAAQQAIAELAQALSDPDEPVRLNAAAALAAAGEPVPALGDALRSTTDATRRYAAYALTAMGAPAVDLLADVATCSDEQIRVGAIDALGDMGLAAAPAASVVADALRSHSPWVRRHAAEALGTLGPGAACAVAALAEALGDEQPYVRFNAATALARLGPSASEAIPALVAALDDADRYARAWAALALRRIGTPEATAALLDHLMVARWCSTTQTDNRY